MSLSPYGPGSGTIAALTDVLFAGRFDAVHAPWRALCDDRSLYYPATAGPRERVDGSYRRLRQINELVGAEALVNDVEGLAALHEWLCPVEGGLATVAGIHYNLFLGSLFDHDADARRDLAPFVSMRQTGIFLCTEVGHGNDAARLETTATYDASTGGFVLHTPAPAAQKFMPNASTAGGPKAGLVAARLIHSGEDRGVFLFLTPLTDDRGALPGVRIRRLSDKVGYSVDHCLTAFDRVRLPPHAFLAGGHGRLTADGAFTSSVGKHRLRFLRSIDRVTPGKLSMSAGAVGLTRTALTIAVRYAHTRRTTGLLGGRTVPLFEHAGHRTRLLDALADTYALTLLHRAVLSRWVRDGAAGRARNDRLVAIAKAWITWQGRAVAIECRERCGAQGLLPFNGIAELPDYYTAGITAEGDNLVIWLKAAGELLGEEMPEPAATAPGGHRLDDPEFLQALLGDLEYIWHRRARARWLGASSTSPLDQWNAATGPALEMATAHAQRHAGRSLLSAATRSGHHEARALLTCVHRLFALRRVARYAGDLLAEGRITAGHVGALSDAADAALAELAPHALTLVDALAVSPRVLDRYPIARTDFLDAFDSVTRHTRTEEREHTDVRIP